MAIRYFGLHWADDSGAALQARVDLLSQQVWARCSDKGGEWTEWRRLDVERSADETIKGVIEKAIKATSADTASRLARAFSISLTGEVTGSAKIDGATPVEIVTKVSDNGELAKLRENFKKLTNRLDDTDDNFDGLIKDSEERLETLERRQGNIISQVRRLMDWAGSGDGGAWNPDYQ